MNRAGKSAMEVQGQAGLRRRKNWDLVSLNFRIKTIDYAGAFQTSKRHAGAMRLWTLNLPGAFFPNQSHFISASPPIIEVARKRNPHFRLLTKLRKASQQAGIYVAGALFEEI